MQLKINACGYEASVLQNLPFLPRMYTYRQKKSIVNPTAC